jgi:hypothetical protein
MEEDLMRTMMSMLAACGLLVATPQAQNPPTPEPPAHKTMLLAGCLVAGTDTSTFKLARASEIVHASASQPKAVGTSGNQADYELVAATEAGRDTASVAPVDLKAFVGHQVEVTVRPIEAPAPDPSKPVQKPAERFTVTAIKPLLAICQ